MAPQGEAHSTCIFSIPSFDSSPLQASIISICGQSKPWEEGYKKKLYLNPLVCFSEETYLTISGALPTASIHRVFVKLPHRYRGVLELCREQKFIAGIAMKVPKAARHTHNVAKRMPSINLIQFDVYFIFGVSLSIQFFSSNLPFCVAFFPSSSRIMLHWSMRQMSCRDTYFAVCAIEIKFA